MSKTDVSLAGEAVTERPRRGDRDSFDVRAEQIYRVAIEVFSEYGYVAGTTSEIARRVGVTQPALYHYAKSKHAFLVLICQRIGSRMLEGMRAATSHDGPPIERVRVFVTNHIQNVVDERAAFSVYATESRHLRPEALNAIREQEREYLGAFTTLIHEAQKNGSLSHDVEPWTYARLAIGCMNWIYRWYHDQLPVASMIQGTLGFLGIRARA